MFRFIIPTILIGVAIAGSVMFAKPMYEDIQALKEKSAAYETALANAKALEAERDKLTQKYNSITADNVERLERLLPNSVDNIRLILEIEKIAAPYGMVLMDVQYSPVSTAATPNNPNVVQGGNVVTGGAVGGAPSTNLGVWDLQFSTQGVYSNLVLFLRDLERNLRIVDVAKIEFSSANGGGATPDNNSDDIYEYTFSIKTYWLKN